MKKEGAEFMAKCLDCVVVAATPSKILAYTQILEPSLVYFIGFCKH